MRPANGLLNPVLKNIVRRFRTTALAVLTVLALLPASAAHAQGCILCYTSLAAAGSRAMHAFQLAMLVLLFPALFLFIGIFVFILRRGVAADAAQANEA
jgi:hypothetical protein